MLCQKIAPHSDCLRKCLLFDKTEKEADWNSIHADWLAVGNDINKAITEEYEAERK